MGGNSTENMKHDNKIGVIQRITYKSIINYFNIWVSKIQLIIVIQ